jgi:hypothetical protein
MCQLDQSSLEAFCDASLAGGWEEEPTKIFLATHEVWLLLIFPVLSAESLLVVGVAQRTEAFGSLSGFLLN